MVVRAADGDTSDTKASGGASVASSVGIVPMTGAGEVANVGSCDATKGGVRYIASGHDRNGFPARAQFVCMGGLSAAGREPTADTSPATAEGIINAGYLRVAGCVALVASAGVADVTGGGVLARGERGTPAQIRVRDSVDAPSSLGIGGALAGASISAVELTCRTSVLSAGGREPTAGGTIPSDVADVMVIGSIADVEVGLGFSVATDALLVSARWLPPTGLSPLDFHLRPLIPPGG
jgi:hypothetical protein